MTIAEREEEQKQEQIDLDLLAKAANELFERFPSVQIFVHRPNGGSIESHNKQTCISAGRGDWYARYGQIKEWMIDVESSIKGKHYTP